MASSSFVTNNQQPCEALKSFIQEHPLSDKSVFITGGGRGVGKHITQAFAEAGASKAFSRDYPNSSFVSYAADITDEVAVAAALKDFGSINVLINNAGHLPDEGPFVEQDLKAWFSGFQINVLGTAVVTQKFLQAKKLGSSPIVLTVSSMAAHMRFPLTGWTGYNSSKLGRTRIFENLRIEHPDVQSISIHPGSVESDGFTRSNASAHPGGMTDGKLAGHFFVWAATEESAFSMVDLYELSGILMNSRPKSKKSWRKIFFLLPLMASRMVSSRQAGADLSR